MRATVPLPTPSFPKAFRRRSGTGPAMHPARQAILDKAASAPGVPELCRATGLCRTAILHHLRVLAKAGLVRIRIVDGRILALPPCGRSMDPRAALPVRRRILALAATPVRRHDLCAALEGVPVRTRNHNVRWLLQEGLLTQTPEGALVAA